VKYLLDTYVLLGVTSMPGRIRKSRAAISAIENSNNELYINSLVILEISGLLLKGAVEFTFSLDDYVSKELPKYRIEILPVEIDQILYTSLLPNIHGDPFDRAYIAHSILSGYPIISNDRIIPEYPLVKVIW